jgi:hypothetical protein
MKKTFLILSLLAAGLSSVSAATLITDNGDSGFTLADGATPLSSGRVRFGIFVVSDSLVTSNASDLAYLDTNFREVASYSGAFNGFALPGFFEQNFTYAGGSTAYGGTVYDLSSGSTGNVANDIAGSKIYMWALDNAVVANATQQAILVDNGNFWTDSDTIGVQDSFFSAANTTALIGSLGTGVDIGAGAPSHSLATVAAIPEPSRAILGLAGLGALFFRRRRNA